MCWDRTGAGYLWDGGDNLLRQGWLPHHATGAVYDIRPHTHLRPAVLCIACLEGGVRCSLRNGQTEVLKQRGAKGVSEQWDLCATSTLNPSEMLRTLRHTIHCKEFVNTPENMSSRVRYSSASFGRRTSSSSSGSCW